MPRANRYFRFFPPRYPWHITHRCHDRQFLLKVASDRGRWMEWMSAAVERYGLRVLNYCVTCNHIHLIVLGCDDPYQVSKSMQLVAGRVAEEYNRRKGRKGAFWEDRYHATLIDSGEYFARCMTYVDLNMVRAGAVGDPGQWKWSGYRELMLRRDRRRIVDREALAALMNVRSIEDLTRVREEAVVEALRDGVGARDERWSECVAVGSRDFIGGVERYLSRCCRQNRRQPFSTAVIEGIEGTLRESREAYGTDSRTEICTLSGSNEVELGEWLNESTT